jgi:hypothetical protein
MVFVRLRRKTVADAKTVVTVQAIRVANGKMIAASKGAPSTPAVPVRPAAVLGDVVAAGRLAMQANKKP